RWQPGQAPKPAAPANSCRWSPQAWDLASIQAYSIPVRTVNDSRTALAVALLAGDRNALFKNIHGDVGLLPGHDERRGDANAVRAASQQKDAALRGEFDDAIAFRVALRLGFFVGDDLDSDHQAASADVAHQIEPLRPIGDAFHDVFAHHLGILDGFTLQHIHGRQRSRNRDWVPAERRSVRTRHPVHDLRL